MLLCAQRQILGRKINKCPMIDLNQRKLDFGPFDQPAMVIRFSRYEIQYPARPTKECSHVAKEPVYGLCTLGHQKGQDT